MLSNHKLLYSVILSVFLCVNSLYIPSIAEDEGETDHQPTVLENTTTELPGKTADPESVENEEFSITDEPGNITEATRQPVIASSNDRLVVGSAAPV